MIKTTQRVELWEDKFCIIECLDYVGKMGKWSCPLGLQTTKTRERPRGWGHQRRSEAGNIAKLSKAGAQGLWRLAVSRVGANSEALVITFISRIYKVRSGSRILTLHFLTHCLIQSFSTYLFMDSSWHCTCPQSAASPKLQRGSQTGRLW